MNDHNVSLIRILERHLRNLSYRDTTPKYSIQPVRSGFAFAEIPDWEIRQMLSLLRNEEICDCPEAHEPNCTKAPL